MQGPLPFPLDGVCGMPKGEGWVKELTGEWPLRLYVTWPALILGPLEGRVGLCLHKEGCVFEVPQVSGRGA